MRGYDMIAIAPTSEHLRLVSVAEACGGFDQRVEHRLQLNCGATDDLEHVAGCGKLVHRTGEFSLTVAQFLEQARILDRDHRLIGEAGGELDLLFHEGFDARPVNRKYTDQDLLA